MAVLAAARAAQGAAAAVSVPAALRLLTTVTAAGAARERAVAAWSATGAAAGASGFVVGGAVTELTSWRWVLLGYVPLAALLGVAVLGTVPPDRRGPGRPASLDLGGAVSLTATVVSLVVGTSLVAEPGRRLLGGLCLLLTGVLGATVVAVERRADWPLLPGAALRLPPLRAGTLASLLNTAATSSVITLATVYLQDVRHHSPLGAGARLLPFSVAVVVGSAASAVLLRRLRPARVIAVGLAVIALATTGLAATTRTAELLPVWVAAAGAGLGVSAVAATAVGIDVPETWRAAASGILNTAAQLGTAVGTALLLLIVSGTGGSADRTEAVRSSRGRSQRGSRQRAPPPTRAARIARSAAHRASRGPAIPPEAVGRRQLTSRRPRAAAQLVGRSRAFAEHGSGSREDRPQWAAAGLDHV